MLLMSNRHLKFNLSKTGPLIKYPNVSFFDLSICPYHSPVSQMEIGAVLGSFLSVIPNISPSLDPVGCSFLIHPTFNLFSVLFCYHLGPSNHHLSPVLEPSFHTVLLSSIPHHVQLSALLHISPLTSIPMGYPAVLIVFPLHMHFSQMKCLASGYPFFAPF